MIPTSDLVPLHFQGNSCYNGSFLNMYKQAYAAAMNIITCTHSQGLKKKQNKLLKINTQVSPSWIIHWNLVCWATDSQSHHGSQQSSVRAEESVLPTFHSDEILGIREEEGCQAGPGNKKSGTKAVLGWTEFYIEPEGDTALNSILGSFFHSF